MSLKGMIVAILGASLVLASPAPTHRAVVHERRSFNQEDTWNKRKRAPPDDIFEMRIGLKQQNLDRGYELLMDVSDPKSPGYGKYWEPEDVANMFKPAQKSVEATRDWIISSGIDNERVGLASSGGWLVFNATVREAEKLLETKYWLYESDSEGVSVGCDKYHVPAQLSEHIDFIYPGVVMAESKGPRRERRQPGPQERKTRSMSRYRHERRQQPNCSEIATPECIAKLYDIPPADKAHHHNSMGFFQKGSWYQEGDLDLFFKTYAPHIPQGTRPLNLSINQAVWHYNEDDPYVSQPDEADLDLDVAYPIIYPQTTTVYQTDDDYYTLHSSNAYFGLFNTFLDAIDGTYCNYSAYGETGDNSQYDPSYPNYRNVTAPGRPEPFDPGTYKGERMCGTYKPTHVISISYSRAESTYSTNYQMRQCNEWMKLGLQGVTVVGSAGNSGPLATRQCMASNYGSFYASHPGNCPYVTSVGATMLLSNGSQTVAKDTNWASSGGFSWYYPTPAYQQSVVSDYFAEHNPGRSSMYNSSGRGFPDISALGKNVAVAVLGELDVADGTSAATPLVGAMFNRINEERLAVGKSTVGFVNPVLYANPEIFDDIVTGDNSICDMEGFKAVEGWDPTSGLGTPNYPKLLETFMALQ
ncbi:subtilisin-like protein [Daldinia loculata]|uniref:subtilisin-like protein n=1 Tax=Daldinia loculata TaxID=103429 RepID=UPI0020C3DE7B|nr:subtilisin-like protein [Daldinia loculata]KAI1643203.1 subtilisin-like protein [Daldinia loculata]